MVEFKETDHSYYCEIGSEYLETYDTLQDYLVMWNNADVAYNYLFRYDLYPSYADEECEIVLENVLELRLFYMWQRLGIYKPVIIRRVYKNDMEVVNQILQRHLDYIKNLWIEVL